MSNGGQRPVEGEAASKRSGASWVVWAAIGTVVGTVISQYSPLLGDSVGGAWSQGRLVLIPLHVVLFGGVAALVGWSTQRSRAARGLGAASPSVAGAAVVGATVPIVQRAAAIPPSSDSARTNAPPRPLAKPAEPPPPASNPEPAKPEDRHEAITAPPPKMTDSSDGAPTAQRLEIAAQVAQEEEDDRTLVGDLSQLAKAQELAELQRQHRDKKKAELAAAGPVSSKKGKP